MKETHQEPILIDKANKKGKRYKGKEAPDIILTCDDVYSEIQATSVKTFIHSYTAEQKESICNNILNLISKGKSQTKACIECNLPVETFIRWKQNNEFLYKRYVRARESQGDALFDRVLDEVDNIITVEDAIISKARIEPLKWLAGKVNQQYSDRSDVYINNTTNTLNTTVTELSQADRDRVMKQILAKLNGKLDALEANNNTKEKHE